MEAAVLLPALMLVVALLVEPCCLLYTRSQLEAAAAEAARAVLTDYDGDLADCRQLVIRRLGAVPDVAIFHVGGDEGWEVEASRDGGRVRVRVRGHARPLPLLGVVASTLGESDAEGVVLQAEAEEDLGPGWASGGYAQWQTMWG